MTAFVTIFTVALIFVIGLVLDGGSLLAAKRQADNEAESAARAGVQALSVDRLRSSGDQELDPAQAAIAVNQHLSRLGRAGTVAVAGDSVTVTISIEQPLQILGIGGLAQVTVTGQGTARTVRGVDQGET